MNHPHSAQQFVLMVGLLGLLSGCGQTPETRSPKAPLAETNQPKAAADTTNETIEAGSGQPNPANKQPEKTNTNSVLTPKTQVDTPKQTTRAETSQADATLAPKEDQDFCKDAVTQLDFNQCTAQNYEQADAQLNQVYQTLSGQLDSTAAESLTTAELAWIEFRDQDCNFVRNQFAGGSIAVSVQFNCLTARSQSRTQELQQNLRRNRPDATDYSTADNKLNSRYQSLLNNIEAAEIPAIESAQLAWLEYRDRNCTFESLHSPQPISEEACLTHMSLSRSAELQNIIEERSL